MAWATEYIKKLQQGIVVSFRPSGNSMKGKIENGALCTVEPIGERILKINDIVLCEVNGNQYLHLIKTINELPSGEMLDQSFQIGNNHGGINGWIHRNKIYGILIKVEK